MQLRKIIKSANAKYKNLDVRGLCFDSRKIKKGDIFFAIKGEKDSGDKYIKEAILKGASFIVSSKDLKKEKNKIPHIVTKDVRKSLAESSSNFYAKKPSNIVAVTGTNGKTSVVDFFYQILKFNKIPVSKIGTLGVSSKKYNRKMNLTTMDPLFLHKNLEILKKKKVNHVALEASSHGLKQKRLDNLNIKIGIFTNLSHDHLDYHKNMQSYLSSKMHLFKNLLNKKSKIITDEENKQFKYIKKISNKKNIKRITIGLNSGNIRILSNKYIKNKQITEIIYNKKVFFLTIPLIGYFQVKNLLMAILAASSCGINIYKIFKQIGKIKSVPGRLECIADLNNNSNIIIDFAHTPDALEQSLISIKKQFNKDVIIVFGCGGERDKKKRAIMGKIAQRFCRKVFITDDNPRSEDPGKIRRDIINGCKKSAINIGNRKKAIERAIKELRSGELLLIAGKGHETTQDYGKKIISFSDKKIAKSIIKKELLLKKKNRSFFLAEKAFEKKNLKNIDYSGVSIDSKKVKKNNLFIAIKGKNNDGHKFAKEAIKKGAIKAVVSKKINKLSKKKIIKVKNTYLALNSLAKATRANTSAQIIGITGSAGKTTLKNLVSYALKNYGKVHYSPRSYNNKFGVPLSISNLKPNTNFGVFEIGMDKKGEINNLSKIVKPEIAVITNIAEAHLKNFRTTKEIAKAKGEIINNILKGGNIILNKDDNFFNFLSKKAKNCRIKVISFSSKQQADIFLLRIVKTKSYYKLAVSVRKKLFYFYSNNITNSFINNSLACIAILYTLNLNLNNIKKTFLSFAIPNGRGDITVVKKFKKIFKFIDESYNANPLSMSSAIKNIDNYKRKVDMRKFIFLGDMLELGKKSKKLHKELSVIINKADVDKVFVYGKYIRETFSHLNKKKRGCVFNTLNEAYDHFSKIIHNNDLLMIKGSNATGLNKFSKYIKKGNTSVI